MPATLSPDHSRFLAYATRTMRCLVIDYARNRQAQKRGGGFEITSLPTQLPEPVAETAELERLGAAIDALTQLDPALAQLVDLKFFCGCRRNRILSHMGLIHAVTRRPLSDFVDFLWLSESYVRPHAAERILPTGNMGLVLNLDERVRVHGVLSGARTRSLILDTSKPLSLMGACFKPGGGFPFFDGPAGELQDLGVCLDTLWGRKAQTLREQLLEARTAPARFHILESFLLDQARRRPGRHPAVRYALNAFQNGAGAPSVAAVTERTGLSARRFIEVFRHEVGLTPKVYCRISRFRSAVSAVASMPTVDWAATASAYGYFDQAHFIHEFGEFAGMSPSAYIRHRTESPNHVRLPG